MKKVLHILTIIFVCLGAVLMEAGAMLPALKLANSPSSEYTQFSDYLVLFTGTSAVFFYVFIALGAAMVIKGGKDLVGHLGFALLIAGAFMDIGTVIEILFAAKIATGIATLGTGTIISSVGPALVVLGLITYILWVCLDKVIDEPKNVKDILLWKDLLDRGIISSEEFDYKKKEILHLPEIADKKETK